MSERFKALALSAAFASGLIGATPVLAEDSHASSRSGKDSEMMNEGGMMGMMGMMDMMEQMNRMMKLCTTMMDTAINKDEDLDRPKESSPTTPDGNG